MNGFERLPIFASKQLLNLPLKVALLVQPWIPSIRGEVREEIRKKIIEVPIDFEWKFNIFTDVLHFVEILEKEKFDILILGSDLGHRARNGPYYTEHIELCNRIFQKRKKFELNKDTIIVVQASNQSRLSELIEIPKYDGVVPTSIWTSFPQSSPIDLSGLIIFCVDTLLRALNY